VDHLPKKFYKGDFDKIDANVRKTYGDLFEEALKVMSFDEEAGKYVPLEEPKKDDPDAPKKDNPLQARLSEKDEMIRKLRRS